MEKDEKRLFTELKRASVLSGIGMGLLLGIIMGLSVSEVVKVIMASLTALLGVFLGFEKRSFTGMDNEEYKKDNTNTLITALRSGSFGIAVVAGILFGMWIRTNEVFTISVKESVEQWTDAGYHPDYARKMVAFQRLGINPTTGEAGPMTELQRGHQSNLFSAEDVESLCATIDPDLWNNDWQKAKKDLIALKKAPLTEVVSAIENNVPESQRFDFLTGLRYLVCSMKGVKTGICAFGTDQTKWESYEMTSQIAIEVTKLPSENQENMMKALSELVCELEKE